MDASRGPPTAADGGSVLPPRFFQQPVRVRRRHVERLASRSAGGGRGLKVLGAWHETGDPGLVPTLLAVLGGDPDSAVRRCAVMGLGRVRDPAVLPAMLPALLAALRAPDRRTRFLAAAALGRLGVRDAVPPLIALLSDRYCRLAAADSLLEIGDRRALLPLLAAAGHGPPWRRRRILRCARELAAGVR